MKVKPYILLIFEFAIASSLFFFLRPKILDVVYTGHIPSHITFNIIYSSLLESNYNSIIYIISLILGKYDTLISNFILFLIGYFSMFYSMIYFSGKYTRLNKSLTYSIATGFSFIYLAYPFFGTGFYVVFDSFLPLVLVLYDKFFTEYYSKPKPYMISSVFIMTLVASLAITDFRTIIYIPILFILFFIYYNITKHSFQYFKKTIYMSLYATFFLIALDLRYFLSIYLISHVGTSALGNTTSLQFAFAYESFPLLNSIAGNIQWYTTYNSDLIIIALLPFLLILIAISLSKGLKILRFMFLILLALILFDTYGETTINYAIGQTAFYSYLPILFPTYVIAVLYYPLLMITSGFSLSIITDKIIHVYEGTKNQVLTTSSLKNRLKRTIPLVISITVIILMLTSQVYYLEPSVENNRNKEFYDPVPLPLEKAFSFLNKQNTSGHIIEIGNFSNSYYNYSYWPPATFSPLAGWGASWYTHPVYYFMEHNLSNLAGLLKYLGVEYIMYRFTNYTSLSYFQSQDNMSLVFHNSSIYIFLNQNYAQQIQSNDLYAVYNLPESMSVLSQLNETYPIIPFYDLLKMHNPTQYISGIIGYNISDSTLEPLFLNTSNSYFENIGSMNINNLSGWQQMPVINSGDDIQALAPDGASTLNLRLHVPSGKYQLLLIGGVSPVPTATWNYGPFDFSANASLKIYSDNSSYDLFINQENFSPYSNVYEINNLSYSGENLDIQSLGDSNGTPFISYIYLVPESIVGSITQVINKYEEKSNILNYYRISRKNGMKNATDYKSINIPFALALCKRFTDYNTNYKIIISYKDVDIAGFSYVQNAKLKGEILHTGYFYGAGFVYISTLKNTTLIYGNYNGYDLILINVATLIISSLYTYLPFYLKRKRSND